MPAMPYYSYNFAKVLTIYKNNFVKIVCTTNFFFANVGNDLLPVILMLWSMA